MHPYGGSILRDIPCTVITNSLNVALKAIPYENIGVMILPGRLTGKTWSFAGRDIEDHLASLNIRKAFMATTGVSVRGGLTNASEDEYFRKEKHMPQQQQYISSCRP